MLADAPRRRSLLSRAVRNVCVVGVGLADGPKTPGLSALMLQAQAFGRAVADANLTKNDVDVMEGRTCRLNTGLVAR